ncbi:MAG: endonuclease/exonuclease/phosphatase family protein [Planctomycetaceae bacterium]|nr:endonuclease/exonuclease/phosphatase family protein [Planctomycetaceae bacterium]
MRSFCFFAVSLFALSSLFADGPIRVLSINVRLSTVNDGENNWANRKDFMTEIIAEGNYDFIGTQETIMHPNPELNQVAFIASKLPGHGVLGRSREVNPEVGEAMTIFYKKERWQIDDTDQETFWLSDTPDVPGSKTDPQAGCPRTVTVALFHELKDGKPTERSIYVYNTHYDHMSEGARQRGAKQLMDRIADRKNKDVPVIVIGDLNNGERSPAIRYMKGEPMTLDGTEWTPPFKLVDTFREVHPDATDVGTFNGFRAPGRDKIDYIFVSPGLKTLSAEIIRTQRDGKYPTDHFPVDAVIEW